VDELFSFDAPCISQNVVHIHSVAGENLIDLVDSFRLVLGILVRQPLRIFGLVFRKIVLKNFGKTVRKLLRIQFVVIVLIELVIHEIFQRFNAARSD
jgi:hypothetical protein